MSISVVVPIHNAESFLLPTLDSIGQALGQNDELVAVFDSCVDRSVDMFEMWRETNRKLVGFDIRSHSENFGSVALARNKGMELADRRWITFADHDDRTNPSIYRDLVNAGENSGCDVVRSGYVKDRGKDTELVYPDFCPDFYAFFGIFVWNSAFRADLLKKNSIRFLRGYGEDYEFNLQVAQHCEGQTFVKKPLYIWNLHGKNQHMSRKPIDFVLRASGIFERHKEYIMNVPNSRESFFKWVRDYIQHLGNEFSNVDIRNVFISNKSLDLFEMSQDRPGTS